MKSDCLIELVGATDKSRTTTVEAVITIEPAAPGDLEQLVVLENKLFHEDAGRHGTYPDLTWPEREAARDFIRLLADPACLVLVARDDTGLVGHLVAYTSAATPTRQEVTFAVLRSMYVLTDRRNHGVGNLLADRFLSWARVRGCVEAQVSAYVANEGAQRFYQGKGFIGQSLSLAMPL
ncbi:MAG: GNAT family N-acetyltransferase [Marmoricola sp.]